MRVSGNRKSAAERRLEASERAAAGPVGINAGSTRIGGVTGAGFKPGQSGNPSGRPRGLASQVKESTSAAEIVEGFLGVARDPRAKPAERIAAWRELADRGWGKAPAFAAIEGRDPLELGAIAAEVQAIADELRARRDARESAAGTDSQASVASG